MSVLTSSAARHRSGRPAHGPRRPLAVPIAALAGWYALLLAAHVHHLGYSWRFFALGGRLVLGSPPGAGAPGGLHLYANYPQLQIGPLSLLVAAPFAHAGRAGELAAIVLMAAAGPALLYVVARHARHRITRQPVHFTLAGGVFLALWTEVGVYYAHLDDALVIGFTLAAVLAVRRHRLLAAGVWLGLAVAAKPWALVFVPLLLAPAPFSRARRAAPRLGRARWQALAAVAALAGLAWLPFFAGDPKTLGASRFTIETADGSVLHALGVHAARTPAWDRPAQLVLALALGLLAVRRGRWVAVVALGVIARMLLDPGAYNYYTAGLAAGALLWDLLASAAPLPWASLVTFAGLYVPALIPGAEHSPWLPTVRLAGLLTAAAVVLLLPTRTLAALPAGAAPHADSADVVPLIDLRRQAKQANEADEADPDDASSPARARRA